MSWDIYVQDLPEGIHSVAEIPDDWMPRKGIVARQDVLRVIRDVIPSASLVDLAHVTLDDIGCRMEISIGMATRLDAFAFFVYGGERAAAVVGEILRRLGLRALDSASDSGLFDIDTATASFARWLRYRDQVTGGEGYPPPTSEGTHG